MRLRVINAGVVSPLYSQAIYHGIAEQIQEDDDPVLIIVQPDKPYICIGLHQQLKGEVDIDYCLKNDIPIFRRHVGGGTVLLDDKQVFFQYIFPKEKAPNQPKILYPYLLQSVLHTYHQFGIPASLKSLSDIQVSNKKIGGTGAGTINNAIVLVGSFLYDFDYHLMSQCAKSPSELFKSSLEGLLEQKITTISSQITNAPAIEDLIETFLQNTKKLLEVDIEITDLTSREIEAINQAEKDLTDEEWLNIESNKLISNGLKIASGVYLLEQTLQFYDSELTIRIKYEEKAIHTIWMESNNPKVQASLIFTVNDINMTKPSVDYDIIYEITQTAFSKLNSLNDSDASILARAIFDLANFTEY